MSFKAFAESHGLILRDLISDGRWHRTPTLSKPKKKNGAYLFDGVRGVVKDWATEGFATWRKEGARSKVGRAVARDITRSLQAQRERYARSRMEAASIIAGCVRDTHPYLAAKGFPGTQGLIHPSGDLVIPMRDCLDYGTINSVQRISADGAKLFLSGGKAKGSIFVIGKGAWHERWLCEGYATGLSVQAALLDLRRQAEIIVTFSASNLQYVSQFVKRPAYVMADHDKKSTAGKDAAIATGLPWVMPEEPGFDANDLHQQCGLRALVKLIQAEWSTTTIREMHEMSSSAAR